MDRVKFSLNSVILRDSVGQKRNSRRGLSVMRVRTFIPINFKPEEQVKVVPESENRRRAECRSFFVTRDSFTIAKWEYNKDENKYHLNPPTELTTGSPVLCRTDKNKRNYVVGVIRHQNSNPEYFPEMFNREHLVSPFSLILVSFDSFFSMFSSGLKSN